MSAHTTEQFAVGDRVTWTSGAGGKAKAKTGEVVAVVPKDMVPRDLFQAYSAMRAIREAHLDSGFAISPRGHQSYLVSVPGRGKPTLYWPRVKGLRGVEG